MYTVRKILVFSLILATLSTFCGCSSLRKKFIRKKKQQKEIPVYVDFKDYPAKPSRKAYIDYYLFVRGWLDDLTETLERGISYKRQRRAINEAIMNLEQMISFYNTEGKDKIYPLYEELVRIRQDIKNSPNMSQIRKNSLIRRIKNFKRRFEKNFNYTDAQEWMS
ncbi:MAG: hypothetical protein NG737_04630 [Omnitrophica bacterium]|nr:hypothetical protein [Candidatus Omnitrophota bacterium]